MTQGLREMQLSEAAAELVSNFETLLGRLVARTDPSRAALASTPRMCDGGDIPNRRLLVLFDQVSCEAFFLPARRSSLFTFITLYSSHVVMFAGLGKVFGFVCSMED